MTANQSEIDRWVAESQTRLDALKSAGAMFSELGMAEQAHEARLYIQQHGADMARHTMIQRAGHHLLQHGGGGTADETIQQNRNAQGSRP